MQTDHARAIGDRLILSSASGRHLPTARYVMRGDGPFDGPRVWPPSEEAEAIEAARGVVAAREAEGDRTPVSVVRLRVAEGDERVLWDSGA